MVTMAWLAVGVARFCVQLKKQPSVDDLDLLQAATGLPVSPDSLKTKLHFEIHCLLVPGLCIYHFSTCTGWLLDNS